VPQGGDGCAANCTTETDVPYLLIPGDLKTCMSGPNMGQACSTDRDCGDYPCNYGSSIAPGTSGVTIANDVMSIPLPFGPTCNGGNNAGYACASDTDCPGGACVPSQETFTIGKECDGTIPMVVKADSVRFSSITVTTGACGCIRGAAAKTCGGTMYESDGVTPATDCTSDYTAGESVCAAAGKPPCTFVHGEGNTASGEIGCDGLDHINVKFSQDSGGASGIAGSPMVTFSGSGGPGSASLLSTIGITAVLGSCTGTDVSVYGPDRIYCTTDDPPGGITSVEGTSPAVTGTATVEVLNTNGTDGHNLGPVTVTGAPFSCSALVQGSAAGAGLVQAFAFVHLDTVGDVAATWQFVANGTVPPTPPPTPTVSPGACVGDCDGDGSVHINELIRGVNIALGNADPGACPAFDCNADCHGGPSATPIPVNVACLVRAVNNTLFACPPSTCSSEADCDDGNACSIDQCTPEGCVHQCVCL